MTKTPISNPTAEVQCAKNPCIAGLFVTMEAYGSGGSHGLQMRAQASIKSFPMSSRLQQA